MRFPINVHIISYMCYVPIYQKNMLVNDFQMSKFLLTLNTNISEKYASKCFSDVQAISYKKSYLRQIAHEKPGRATLE